MWKISFFREVLLFFLWQKEKIQLYLKKVDSFPDSMLFEYGRAIVGVIGRPSPPDRLTF